MSLKLKLATVVVLLSATIAVFSFPAASNWVVLFLARNDDISVRVSAEHADLAHELVVQATEYNERLRKGLEARGTEDTDAAYQAALRLPDSDYMGRVVIPKINVSLNVYHGSESVSLERGAGHLYGTSLPVGGPGTHTAISAHSGLVKSKRFSDLDRLEEGDVFILFTPDHQVHYKVDYITVVPADSDMKELAIVAGEDYVTLITCTPIGINTHRLLVRGVAFTPETDFDIKTLAADPGVPWWAVIWLGPTGLATGGAIGLNKWATGGAKKKEK